MVTNLWCIAVVFLRAHVDETFFDEFKRGIDTYLAGDWVQAKVFLENANRLMAKVPKMTGDGPSLTLLKYIEEYGGKAPENWGGFRPLTSK